MIDLLPGTIKQQLELLLGDSSKLAKYQSVGVIAGGAVANLIYNLNHNTQVPINDIDVFVFNQRQIDENKYNDGAVVDYQNEIGSLRNNFQITSSKREGLINVVTIDVDYISSLEEMGKELIEGFDINCTKACITLESDSKLIIHDEFKEFVKTKQLISFKNKTPIKTMLRLLKKKKEFNAYLSEYHLESIYQLSRAKVTRMNEENFLKYPEELLYLRSFFRFFKMSDGMYQARYFKPYLEIHRSEKKIMKNPHLRPFMTQVFDWRLSKNKMYDKYLKVRPYRKTIKSFIAHNLSGKLKDDFNTEDLIFLEKILQQVQATSSFFIQGSLNQAIGHAKVLSRYSDQSEIYLGFLGTLCFSSNEDISSAYEVFKKEYLAKVEPVVDKIVISDETLNSFVEELVSQSSLVEEGRRMSHCVAGYLGAIKEKKCRIFSIRTTESRSTLEVRWDKGFFIGVQHKAFANSFPCVKNRDVAQVLLSYLNEHVSLENTSGRVLVPAFDEVIDF